MLPENFHEMPRIERLKWLDANADDVGQEESHYKDLSPEQIDKLESEITQLSISVHQKEEEYDEVKKAWREEINEVKDSLSLSIKKFREGQEQVVTDVYYIADYENGRMIGYAPDGVEVVNRRLTQEEKQSTIHSLNRAQNQ